MAVAMVAGLTPAQQLKSLNSTNTVIKGVVGALGRQIMLQQLAIEERVRSDGDSGLKQVRGNRMGTKPYHAESHTGSRICGIHDHSNNIRTIGMGEFIGVLNGVEFRTRHNDYGLRMPSKTSKTYHAVQDVPFPKVPPAVLNKRTIDEQIIEMREWFKAFKNQDYSRRDYRPYFRPVISYLEGSWTVNSKTIEEPFFSDRHFVDAKSWFDLQEKIRFTSYTGRKSSLENYSYLPTKIMNMKDGIIPNVAQWNYRIMCHPITGDLPLNRIRLVDDLASRMSSKRTVKSHTLSRAARFQINPLDSNTFRETSVQRNFLDTIMEQIPGKDNYQGSLIDDAFRLPAYEFGRGETKKINAAYYHRYFKTQDKDAMGSSSQHRGYSDANIFMSMTTQPKVAPMTVESCDKVKGSRNKVCNKFSQRWTYAIPMEIIYTTPLNSWNPYHLKYRGRANSREGRITTFGGRYGGTTLEKAFNGTNTKAYYLTPVEFFSGKKTTEKRDPADTVKAAVGVLDQQNKLRLVSASGSHIMLRDIEGVGRIRLRYPIMPIHGEGSAVWKELAALKDMVMEQSKYLHMYKELPVSVTEKQAALSRNASSSDINMELAYSTVDNLQVHTHTVRLTGEEKKLLQSGQAVYALTSENGGHTHNLEIQATKRGRKTRYYINECDGARRCFDGHGKQLTVLE